MLQFVLLTPRPAAHLRHFESHKTPFRLFALLNHSFDFLAPCTQLLTLQQLQVRSSRRRSNTFTTDFWFSFLIGCETLRWRRTTGRSDTCLRPIEAESWCHVRFRNSREAQINPIHSVTLRCIQVPAENSTSLNVWRFRLTSGVTLAETILRNWWWHYFSSTQLLIISLQLQDKQITWTGTKNESFDLPGATNSHPTSQWKTRSSAAPFPRRIERLGFHWLG